MIDVSNDFLDRKLHEFLDEEDEFEIKVEICR